MEEIKQRLGEEMKQRLALQQSKEALEAELEDLTKSLFEEANSMVSNEAREKFELQQSKKKYVNEKEKIKRTFVLIYIYRLEQELELAKSKISLDEQLLQSMYITKR